jgi:S-adenosylmethionine:tRNA ribosyltransferase-isomerase
MKLSDFDYPVNKNQIAQYPLKCRDSSRLLILHKNEDPFEHRTFKDIADYLNPGDVLVINDTKVIPVRLKGKKPSGGKIEVTLLKEHSKNLWDALVLGMNEGDMLIEQGITASVTRSNGTARVFFNSDTDIRKVLDKSGVMPLPVYIKRAPEREDLKHYQTVYARKEGAVAAPTAGLHFTDRIINGIRGKGVNVRTITLHVGYGTFKPVTAANISDHRMDEESYEIPLSTAEAVNRAKDEGRRVIAVGTTVTRTLESSATTCNNEEIKPGNGSASLFICPGHEFRIIDALITNFHLPKSSPMMLASAFAGLDNLKRAYKEAQNQQYRLFSYGDSMLITQ